MVRARSTESAIGGPRIGRRAGAKADLAEGEELDGGGDDLVDVVEDVSMCGGGEHVFVKATQALGRSSRFCTNGCIGVEWGPRRASRAARTAHAHALG
jgi:hypothetical protein